MHVTGNLFHLGVLYRTRILSQSIKQMFAQQQVQRLDKNPELQYSF